MKTHTPKVDKVETPYHIKFLIKQHYQMVAFEFKDYFVEYPYFYKKIEKHNK